MVGFSQTVTTFTGNQFTTDQFGYYYEIGDKTIKKYSKEAKLQYVFSNNLYGDITSVDVSNPHKIVVFYKDFTTLLILDNTLSINADAIDLTLMELDQATLVCKSYNGGMWFYDPVKFELIRKDNSLTTTNTSGNLSNLLNRNIQPNFLVETNNRIYLNDTINGILVLDNFGTYLKTIPIYGLKGFQVQENFLMYVNDSNQIEVYDFFKLESSVYEPKKYTEVTAVRLQNTFIYVVLKTGKLLIDRVDFESSTK